MSDQPAAFSLGRLIAVVVPVVAIAFGLQYLLSTGYEQAARDEIESNMLARLLGPTSVGPDASIEFKDADGDLVADSPPDDQCIAPQPLVFSYVASEDASEAQSDWQDVMDALGEKLNVAVEYRPYETTSDQLADLASGKLHVAGFNTGAVPVAVKSSGFVPVCTFGREDGEFGYKMLIIAPAGSAIDGPSDLQDKQVTFVRPDSNSGCKAALVLLMNKYQLLPESGYGWSFSLGHDASILGVAAGEIEAAPVASDIFQRMVDAG
ncbi:MAG: PhnD/SsuA/transferrin family substrate-binding protein, partial [Planctomycetota bacterium]